MIELVNKSNYSKENLWYVIYFAISSNNLVDFECENYTGVNIKVGGTENKTGCDRVRGLRGGFAGIDTNCIFSIYIDRKLLPEDKKYWSRENFEGFVRQFLSSLSYCHYKQAELLSISLNHIKSKEIFQELLQYLSINLNTDCIKIERDFTKEQEIYLESLVNLEMNFKGELRSLYQILNNNLAEAETEEVNIKINQVYNNYQTDLETLISTKRPKDVLLRRSLGENKVNRSQSSSKSGILFGSSKIKRTQEEYILDDNCIEISKETLKSTLIDNKRSKKMTKIGDYCPSEFWGNYTIYFSDKNIISSRRDPNGNIIKVHGVRFFKCTIMGRDKILGHDGLEYTPIEFLKKYITPDLIHNKNTYQISRYFFLDEACKVSLVSLRDEVINGK